MITPEELLKYQQKPLKYKTNGKDSKIPIFQIFGDLGEIWKYNLT